MFRYGESLRITLLQIYISVPVKEFENRSVFYALITKTWRLTFWNTLYNIYHNVGHVVLEEVGNA